MPEQSEREQVLAFISGTDRAVAGEVVTLAVLDAAGARIPTRAWAVTDRRRPLVWDANYVWVQEPRGAAAADLARAAEAILGGAGMDHRLIVVADARAGEQLTPEFAALGWQAVPYLLMAHRHRRMLADTDLASEVPTTDRRLQASRRAMVVAAPWGGIQVADQILGRDALIDRLAHGRSFVSLVDGAVASSCQLWRRDRVGRVDTVGTVPQFRNRGLARAVVSLATAEARRVCDLVFLCADAHGWPQQLYRRLGYEPVGMLHRFCPTLPGLPPNPA